MDSTSYRSIVMMLKWMCITPLLLLLGACCCRSSDIVTYQQVTAVPVCHRTIIFEREPVNVTRTVVEYY